MTCFKSKGCKKVFHILHFICTCLIYKGQTRCGCTSTSADMSILYIAFFKKKYLKYRID